tara:strand:- start:25872 stop:27089 length:1218 start_codon:yes stop_codon:yes gene_type:complete
MKKFVTYLLILCSLKSFSQDNNKDSIMEKNEWSFKIGANIVDNRGTGELFGGLSRTDQSAFGDIPLTLAIEKRISRLFGIEALVSLNSWDASTGVIDGLKLPNNEGYYAFDVNAKLYLNELFNFSPEFSWLNIYANAGLGRFTINKGTFTANYGGGATIWVSDRLGLDFSTTIKNAFNDSELYETGHFLYTFGLVIKLGKKEIKKKIEVTESVSFVDSDGDSIPDDKDSCPNDAGYIDNNGCPYTDTDNDGVLDKADNCPQIKGSPSNGGCPMPLQKTTKIEEPKKEAAKLTAVNVSKKIKFESGNYNFTQDTYPHLIDLAKILISEPLDVRFEIIGHTDSVGDYKLNRTLSFRRASAVRNYLVDSGISKDRISVAGLGESEPIDNNLTEEGRNNNRRVEIKIIK